MAGPVPTRIRVDRDVKPAIRLAPGHGGNTRRTERRGWHQQRYSLREGGEHHIHHALRHIGGSPHGGRVFRRQDRAGGDGEARGAERAAIDRHLRKHMLERHQAHRLRRAVRNIHRPACGGRRAGEVEMHVAARDRQRQHDTERHVVHPVIVEPILHPVRAVRNVGDQRAHLGFGAVHHFGDATGQRRLAIFGHQRQQPTAARAEHVGHRRQITLDLRRQPDVGLDQLHQRRVVHAAVIQLERRDDHALLMDLGRRRGPAAGHAAAQIHPVPGVGEQRKEPSVDKHG